MNGHRWEGEGAENAGIENAAVAKCGNKKWQALNG